MNRPQIRWTRFSVRNGSRSHDGKWLITPPATKELYASRGVALYVRTDAEHLPYANRYQEVDRFRTYQEARAYAEATA